jgi:hypothetical protein
MRLFYTLVAFASAAIVFAAPQGVSETIPELLTRDISDTIPDITSRGVGCPNDGSGSC